MIYILPVNAGACLSPKDELAQEHLRIRHVQRIDNLARHYRGIHIIYEECVIL